MSSQKKFYITTTLPYVNAEPHMGTALEFVRADIIARYKKLLGFDVFLNTGTDEHGLKVYRKAREIGKDSQQYVDEYAEKFKTFVQKLGMLDDLNFIRTTDAHHIAAAQEFWKRCQKAGHIYKKNYKIKYCVGCELEKTDSELENGRCPIHPKLELEIIEEENYFFTFSKFKEKLLALFEKNPSFVVPDSRLNEIKKFVERGPEDFSISRLKSKMPWGVEVPGDPNHVMSVWFDALVNYISAIGWPDDLEKFKTWWPVVQYCGKDNLRQQSAMWQAMLMSVGLPPSERVIVNGFILGEGGVKMSKSLGNTIDPLTLIEEYGTDALRFYLARHANSFEDSEFTLEKFKTAYNADLANGLGNLVSRIMTMAVDNEVSRQEKYIPPPRQSSDLEKYEISKEMDRIWKLISDADLYIQLKKPFSLIKTDEIQAKIHIKTLLGYLSDIAFMLLPIMPKTAEKIEELIIGNKTPEKPLFPRKN